MSALMADHVLTHPDQINVEWLARALNPSR